jgi:protein arginine phosphatase
MPNILFVCTGNTCRSPLAEGLMRKLAREAGLSVEVRSAGVFAADGGLISNHSAAILKEHGEKVDGFGSSSLSRQLVEWADLVLTMTLGHKGTVIQRFPDALDKTYALKELVELNDDVIELLEERGKLLSEIQMKLSLSQPITAEEKVRLAQLEQLIPDFDIMDPFGGSLEIYRATAQEIEQGLRKLILRMQQ